MKTRQLVKTMILTIVKPNIGKLESRLSKVYAVSIVRSVYLTASKSVEFLKLSCLPRFLQAVHHQNRLKHTSKGMIND